MSGGHWGYLQHKFEEAAEPPGDLIVSSLRLLGQIEHELDWGHSCDTCLGCARLRVLAALDVFFNANGTDSRAALAVLRDRQAVENYCDECLGAMQLWGRAENAKPTLNDRDRELSRRRMNPRINYR